MAKGLWSIINQQLAVTHGVVLASILATCGCTGGGVGIPGGGNGGGSGGGNGGMSAGDSTIIGVSAEITGHLTSGDFNGDGIPDLVFAIRTLDGHPSGSNVDMLRVTYGTGTGAFSGSVDIARLGSSDASKRGHHLIAGDFDGDAIDDFAIASGNILDIFAGDAGRNHATIYRAGTVTRVIGAPLYAFDADGDTDLDLLTINFDLMLTTNDNASFDNAITFDSDLIAPTNFTPGDFDGDGTVDVLAIGQANVNDLVLGLFAGDGQGRYALPSTIAALSGDLILGGFAFDEFSKELEPGDFDGDGDLDVAITSTTDFVQIMLNDGGGEFTPGQRVGVGNAPIHVRASDMDGDNELDLVTLHRTSKSVVISPGNGDGTFADSTDARAITIQLDGEVDVFDLLVTDLDLDGVLDIALAEDGTNPPDTGRGSVLIFLGPGQ